MSRETDSGRDQSSPRSPLPSGPRLPHPICFQIPGQPRSKKNSTVARMVRTKRGNMRIIHVANRKAQDYEQTATTVLQSQKSKLPQSVRDHFPIRRPVNVSLMTYVASLRRADLINLMAAPLDALVRSGILADDNWQIVRSHNGSGARLDRENPRVEIVIENAEDK
jgi:Holliday junction resolvase RusA-like endonuclease